MKQAVMVLSFVLLFSYFVVQLQAEERDRFAYIKLGPAAMGGSRDYNVGPIMGIGGRFERTRSAIDISVNWGRQISHGYYYSIPRIMYFHYSHPEREASFYAGGGASLGGVVSRHHQHFHGLFGDLAMGYEFERKSSIRMMLQLDLMQPALPFSKEGNFPPPVLALSFGVAF